jgi:hypothetical protein
MRVAPGNSVWGPELKWPGLVVNVGRYTVKWRAPTASDAAKKYVFGVLDFFRGAAELGGAELPQKIDPRGSMPEFSKKYAPGKLGYYASWAEYKRKGKVREWDKYERY